MRSSSRSTRTIGSRITCGGIISPLSSTSVPARPPPEGGGAREGPSIADNRTSRTTDRLVTTMLLVTLAQYSRSGRFITAVRLDRVGGIGGAIGFGAMSEPCLKVLDATTYRGTENRVPTTSVRNALT